MRLEDEVCSSSYSQFACIGTGFSAIGLGATLKRWYGITDVQFFERNDTLGGTWHTNQYPGCACDVPSALYSFSFESNPNWSRVLPPNDELWAYLKRVSDKYELTPKMTFGATVDSAVWNEEKKRWRLRIRRNDGTTLLHESQFLFSGVGQLTEPRELDAPGVDTFEGPIFHSARWRADVDLTDKKVVIIGNGCTAAQIVPQIVGKTEHLTQIARSKHWIVPPIDARIATGLQSLLKWVPGMMTLQRFIVFAGAEYSFRGFYMTDAAAKFRKHRQRRAEKYMRSTAPEKYHDMLIPNWEIGCKRRIYDSNYLASLHSKNLTLTNSPIQEITANGVRTKDGLVEADVVILANGFATNQYLGGVNVAGRGGKTIREHWDKFGGAEAYNCSVLSGFPNFFLILGPNSATGHTSTVMAIENSINYALRVIKPVIDGKMSAVDLKPEAEVQYAAQIQEDLQKSVWGSGGCTSWYVKEDADSGKAWNAMTYPYTQPYFWYRCMFPVWSDWNFIGPKMRPAKRERKNLGCVKGVSLTVVILAAAASLLARKHPATWAALLSQSQELLCQSKGLLSTAKETLEHLIR